MNFILPYSERAICIFIIIFLSYHSDVSGQARRLKTYYALYKGTQGIIEVDTSLENVAPIKSQPFTVWTSAKIFDCEATGLPTKNELQMLLKFSTIVDSFIHKSTKSTFAGTFAHGCLWIDYHFVADTIGLRENITNLYRERFPNRTLGLKIKSDKDWDAYFNFLRPGGKSIELIIQPINSTD